MKNIDCRKPTLDVALVNRVANNSSDLDALLFEFNKWTSLQAELAEKNDQLFKVIASVLELLSKKLGVTFNIVQGDPEHLEMFDVKKTKKTKKVKKTKRTKKVKK